MGGYMTKKNKLVREKKYIFFYPHMCKVSGGENFFLGMADYFKNKLHLDSVFVTCKGKQIAKYSDTVSFINYEDDWLDINENDVFFVQLNMVPWLLKKICYIKKAKICIISFHPQTWNYFFSWWQLSTNNEKTAVAELIRRKNAICFMDKSYQLIANKLSLKNFEPKYVPCFTDEKIKKFIPCEIVNVQEINIGIISRLDVDKIWSVINCLDTIKSLDENKKINVHIIGDGNSKKLIKLNEYNFNIIMCGTLCGEALYSYIKSHTDFVISMGMASLDVASLGHPSLLMPLDSNRTNSNSFFWIYDTCEHFMSGPSDIIEALKIETIPLKKAIDQIYCKNQKKIIAQKCYLMFKNNFSERKSAENLLKCLNDTNLEVQDFLSILKARNFVKNTRWLDTHYTTYYNSLLPNKPLKIFVKHPIMFRLFYIRNKIYYKIWKHYYKYFVKKLDRNVLLSGCYNKTCYKLIKFLSANLVKNNIILKQDVFLDKVNKAFTERSDCVQNFMSVPEELRWQYMPVVKPQTMDAIIKYASYQRLNQIILLQLREKLKIQKKVRVAFYVQKIFQYESLFREMEKDPLFEPFIVVIPDKLRHLNTSTDETIEIYKEYKEKYDSVYLGYDFNQNQPIDFIDKIDILFFSIPYAGMHYSEQFIWHALTNRVLTCFQNYGYFTTKWGRTNIAVTPFFNCCWKVFTDSVETFHDLQVYQPLHAQNAVITGYCKMDGLAQYQQKVPNKRKTILICPHHTVWDFNGICLSNFLQYAEFFLELPKKFPQVDFIFRPHPLLFYNLVYSKKIWTEEQKNEYLKKMTSYRNVTFDDNISFFESFAKSDACIHDCGSFTAEYFYTENPCCYMLKNKAEIDEQFLPIGKECLEVYYQAYSQTEIEKFIQSVVIEENDPLKDKRKILAKKIKVNYPNVGKYILNYLKKELFS